MAKREEMAAPVAPVSKGEESAHGFPSGESFDLAASRVADLLRGSSVASRPASGSAPATPPDDTNGDHFGDALERVIKGEARPAPETAPAGKLDLAAVAERLGISIEDLYGVEVGMPDDGQAVTLTELKDLATAHKRSQAERLEWETTHAAQRNQIATATAELQTLLGMIPAEMRSPEMIRQAQSKLEVTRAMEQQKLLARVPEWRDPRQFEAEFEVIRPHLSEWGFSDEELSGVYDSRLLAYIRHNALREKRLADLLAETRKQRERRAGPRTIGGKPDATTAPIRRGNDRNAAADAVANLLRNGK